MSQNQTNVSDDHRPTLVRVLSALSAAQKGHELLSQSCQMLQAVLLNTPDLEVLKTIFKHSEDYDRTAFMRAKARTKYCQKPVFRNLEHVALKLASGKFKCRLCHDTFGSWSGCDSHIRSAHSRIFYGPCPCGHTSSNIDSFRRHSVKCQYEV